MISGHLLPDRKLGVSKNPVFSGDVLGAVVDLPEIVTHLRHIAARCKVSVFVDGNVPPVCFKVKVGFYIVRHFETFHILHIKAAQHFLIVHAGMKVVAVQVLRKVDQVLHRATMLAAVHNRLQRFPF